MSDPSDILERARSGDTEAFQLLVRPHIDSIRRFARSFAGNQMDADDLAQDALIKAFRAISAFDGRSSLATWLYTIAKHQFLDYRRGRLFQWRKRESELTDGDRISQPGVEALVAERERADLLWANLQRLPEKFRIPLVLSEIDGLSYEEVAEIEKIPVGTVRSRISRGKSQLRTLLELPAFEEDASSGTSPVATSSYPMNRGIR